MNQPVSPTKHERDIRFANMKLMKQQILDIRQRKQSIPKVQQPIIVKTFQQLYKIKANQIKKKLIAKRIEDKQKQYNKIHGQLQKYKEKYGEKQRLFKEKQHVFKVLVEKLEMEYEKTKTTFRDVGFNRSITSGVRKLNYYRVGQIIFNQNARRVFSAIQNMMQAKSQEQVGICIGYLGLLISIVAQISGARIWFDFIFRGAKSIVRLNDGSLIMLKPKQSRFNQGINVMIQQLYQIMHDSMGIKIQKSANLYQMCQELSKFMLD